MRQRLDNDTTPPLAVARETNPSSPDGGLRRPPPGHLRRSDRARAWIEWFGPTRLVTSAVAVVVVCLGAWWLVRTPPPPTEAALPMASGASSSPPSALPVTVAESAVVTDDPVIDVDVVVHVAGAVNEPGVYALPSGSRVDDAVTSAGGARADADPGRLNLAAIVIDGSRVYVPTTGEEFVESAQVQGGTASPEPVGPVDVNRATADELDALPGIGPATAAAIVAERDRNGPFAAVADLERVPGIGPAKVTALDGLVTT